MLQSLKKTRPYIAITLLVQSFTFVILFFMLYSKKKKSIASAFLALAGAGAALGGYLLWLTRQDEREESEQYSSYLNHLFEDGLSDMNDWDDADLRDFEIPMDETVDETEFT